MSLSLKIGAGDGVTNIEQKIARFHDDFRAKDAESSGRLEARISSDRRASYFKDIWSSLAVATAIDQCAEPASSVVIAWGVHDWARQDDEDGFALSYPGIVSLQRGASVVADAKPNPALSAVEVKRNISRRSGVIGSGARQRTVIELDPDLPIAARLSAGPSRRNSFFEFVRSSLAFLELSALGRKGASVESAAKGTILEFLYELHSNGYEHAQKQNSARFLRLQKHQYPSQTIASQHAVGFDELLSYIRSQETTKGFFNLVEASVSDFGPGIVDGFLSTFAGRQFFSTPRGELLGRLLHEQLSSKSSDPNAGLGIGHALAAAHELDAFVSLRTAEFWLTMSGKSGPVRMNFRNEASPIVTGTHWQLLLPEPIL